MLPSMLVIVLLTLGALPAHAWSSMHGTQNSVPSSAIEVKDAFDAKSAPSNLLGQKFDVDGHTYTWGECVGSGKGGVVYKLTDKLVGKLVAWPSLGEARQEIRVAEILKGCEGKHIVKIVGHKMFDENQVGASNRIVIIMEYLRGGDLSSQILPDQGLDTRQLDIRDIFKQIVKGVKHMHDKGVAHLDLHPGNIFLGEIASTGTTVKIGDFGSADGTGEHTRVSTGDSGGGNLDYMSPEMCEGRYRGDKSDVWSLGLVLYEMLTGKYLWPQQKNGKDDQLSAIRKSGLLDKRGKRIKQFWASFPRGVTKDAKDLVAKMLEPDPQRRIEVGEVLKHPAMQDGHDAMKGEPAPDASKGPKKGFFGWLRNLVPKRGPSLRGSGA